jgi:Asp-tRNA(Asn)/Glu-tRNA(Gln) amidotransferase A subunit family amidase
LNEINFEEALAEAERLDKHMKQTGKVIGPLHGIPFSVKVCKEWQLKLIEQDQFDVKGLDTTMGYCAWEGRTGEDDWGVVAACKSLAIQRVDASTKGRSYPFDQDECCSYSLGTNTESS